MIEKSLDAFIILEAPPGFEPGDEGFADPGLTTWLWRHMVARDGIEPPTRGFSVLCSTD